MYKQMTLYIYGMVQYGVMVDLSKVKKVKRVPLDLPVGLDLMEHLVLQVLLVQVDYPA